MLALYGAGFFVALQQICVVYYVACIFIHWVIPRALPVQNIQVQSRQPGQVRREALASLGPIAVKAAVLTIVEKLHDKGIGMLYAGWPTDGAQVAYIIATIMALDYLHDCWFYWTHRWLHSRLLYKRIHAQHHMSNVPTAFTGYSFHVIEAAIVFANEILVCFLFPIHIGVHRVYHLFTTVIHNGGHAGYEMAPFIPSLEAVIVALLRSVHPAAKQLSGALNTVQHHDLHHRFPTRHFSLYFTHWDRWCGTEHPAYCEQVKRNRQQRRHAQKGGGSAGVVEEDVHAPEGCAAPRIVPCKSSLCAQQ